nr:glycosyltransferase family 8 protein [Lachnospiraceae bacterium]
MNIIMAFDMNFLLPAITAIYSLFTHNNNINLRILHVNLSCNAMQVIKKLQRIGQNNRIEFIYINDELLDRIKISTGRWKAESFFRFYAAELFPDLDRVLWMDSDILVRNNIEELYYMDFEGNSYAGVLDYTSNPFERLGISEYINSGILMINIEKLRRTDKMQEYWELVASVDYMGDLPDQDALNIIFKGDIKFISVFWNTFPLNFNDIADVLVENSRIVHYVSDHKPWKTEDSLYFLAMFQVFNTAKVF